MNFFEQELRKIIGQSTAAADASYVGRSCFVRLNPDLRAKLTFITMGIASHYEALKMTILNRKEGEVDNTVLRFSDLLGKKQVMNPNFKSGIFPYIWDDHGNPMWYVYQLKQEDYQLLAESVDEYLQVFQSPNFAEPPRTADVLISQKGKSSQGRAGHMALLFFWPLIEMQLAFN